MLQSPSRHLLPPHSNVFFSQPSITTKKPRLSHRRTDRHQFAKPKFEKPMRDVSVEASSQAKFVVEVSGTNPTHVTWLRNEEALKNETKWPRVKRGNRFTLIVNDATVDDAGVYSCLASNSAGTTVTSARLYVIDLNQILDDVNGSTCKDTIKQSKSDKISPESTFGDVKDTNNLEASSTSSYSFSEQSGRQKAGTYDKSKIKRVHIGKNKKKEWEKDDWTKEVRKLIREELEKKEQERKAIEAELKQKETDGPAVYSPNFVQPLTDCCVSVGETAHFVYILTAMPCAEIKWLRNGLPISFADTATSESEARTSSSGNVGFICDDNAGCLIISESDSSHSGVYTCVASNHCGSTKCSARLIVMPLIKVTSSFDEADQGVSLYENHGDRFIDQESQTHESRVDDEDKFITDAFKQLETAEKMQAVEDIVINDDLMKPRRKREKRDGFTQEKLQKKLTVTEQNIARMDDNETGEG